MLSGKRLKDALDTIQKVFEKVNQRYIRKIAEQIRIIGGLGQTNVNRLRVMAEVTSNVDDITKDLAKAAKKSTEEIQGLYKQAMEDTYTDQRFREAFASGEKVPPEDKKRLVQFTNLIYRQTSGTMENLSKTTLVSQNYRDAIDHAILAAGSGLGSYQSEMRDILRSTGMNGIQVQYPSGARRRLDTAVRQNILDGVKEISQNGAMIVGEALEYDAFELSAHLHAAPDHEPVQGRIFLREEFEKMQRGYDFRDWKGRHFLGFPRSIGQWNCMHIAMPFSTVYSTPLYSDRQLQEWAEMNAQGCEFRGKHYTIYEASQLMRQIETRVRRYKDTAIGAKEAGDDVLRRECQYQINKLGRMYNDLASASGLAQQRNRMSVEGFRAVKVRAPSRDNPGNPNSGVEESTPKKAKEKVAESVTKDTAIHSKEPAVLTNAAGKEIIPVKRTTVKGKPNTVTQKENAKGGIDRNYYGDDGRQTKQISNNGHGRPSDERLGLHGEHAHDYSWDENGKMTRGSSRELTDEERGENSDIL